MKPLILDPNQPEDLSYAAALLHSGALVAFPTDTLYGVGADAFSSESINKLFRAKARTLAKGIPVLLDGEESLKLVAGKVPEVARVLMETFWPGPLTIIVPKKAGLPANLSSGSSIAVRVPDNLLTRRFIAEAGGAIAATSANRSGETPACTAEEAAIALGTELAAVLDGGQVEYGLASTILDCTAIPLKIIRSGPISSADLSAKINGKISGQHE